MLASTTTNVGGNTQNLDWDSLFDANGAEKPLPAGFTASGFHNDFNNSGTTFLTDDTSTFATGSKDTLPITPGWQCNFDNNVNSKIDVMNAYAAEYVDPLTGDEILYFALERNTNTGDANVGFWFLQDEVGCESTGGSEAFTGDHVDGDLLVVSAFTKGGTVSTIDVYRWNGGATGSLGTTPVAHGVDCRSASTPLGDTACATANTAPITTPWLTANFKDGVGHTLQTAEFFEGGLNLTPGEPRRQVLQHLPRRHPLVAVADGDPVRLRPRPARQVRPGDGHASIDERHGHSRHRRHGLGHDHHCWGR